MKSTLILYGFLLLFCTQIHAQDKNTVKFGDVRPEDLAKKVYPIDSSAGAVVIADIGSSSIVGNTHGFFSVETKYFMRVHVLNKNSYDVADIAIPVFTYPDGEERLEKIKASTYNLEDGKVVETRLDTKSGIFEDKINKNIKIKKFTFPNVKEGSIIEYEYSTLADFQGEIHPWEFQGKYPELWSEFDFTCPNFYRYTFIKQGYLNFDKDEKKESNLAFNITIPNGTEASQFLNFMAPVTDYKWVIRNVPALKEENYTTTIDNHLQKISFQLVEQTDPMRYHRYIESWPQVTREMLNDEDFGAQLSKDNSWLKEIVNPLKTGEKDPVALAEKIYNYVRDNFTCTGYSNKYLSTQLKNTLKSRKGNDADINLLLTAMMRYVNFPADPVMLSTRSHGYMYSVYPIMDQYNYVICRVLIGEKYYYLDASEPHMAFNRLPLRCYNGDARVVNEPAEVAPLSTDSLLESKTSTIFIINDEKGNIVGSMQQTPGWYESDGIRDRIKDKGQEQFIKDIMKGFGSQIEVSNFGIDSLTQYDNPLNIHYDFDIKDEKEDIIYFSPLFGEAYKENPFKSADRKYPVEMSFKQDETINVQMEVPNGYIVDELPKSLKVKLNEQGDGVFEYQVSQSGNNISLRNRIQLHRSFFGPDEYDNLRAFFDFVVKKQAEQIVFKKKK
jgi:hypothetical protein